MKKDVKKNRSPCRNNKKYIVADPGKLKLKTREKSSTDEQKPKGNTQSFFQM